MMKKLLSFLFLPTSTVPLVALWAIYLGPHLMPESAPEPYVAMPKPTSCWGARRIYPNRMSIPLFEADYRGIPMWFFSGPDGQPDLFGLVLSDVHVSRIFNQCSAGNDLIQNTDAERPTLIRWGEYYAFSL
jgi:hypothetical protein